VPSRIPRIKRQTAIAGFALVAFSMAAAGCGSSAPGKTTGSTNAAVTTANLAKADAVYAQGSQRPTAILNTTPFTKPIPTGKHVYFISCAADFCPVYASIIGEAASMLGWRLTVVPTDGSPQGQQSAIDTALHDGAQGIIIENAERSEFSQQIAAANQKHVPFVTITTTSLPGDGITYTNAQPKESAETAAWMAALIIHDSRGAAGTNTVYVNLPAYQILALMGQDFKQQYQAYCPTCGFSEMSISADQINNAPTLIVSYLRSHPNVNYVTLSVSDILGTGLPAALSAAGLTNKVKILGFGASPAILQYIQSGKMIGTVINDYYTQTWNEMDALARYFTGDTYPPEQITNEWLVTPSSKLPSSAQGIFPLVADYRAQYAKLWGKS
jgi:ABC-type sugar transport system substrate-binding protein